VNTEYINHTCSHDNKVVSVDWWSAFRRLPQQYREELFALSCLSFNQVWEGGRLSDKRQTEISQKGQELMDELLPKGLRKHRQAGQYSTDEEYVKNVLFEGDKLTLPFVAQHLTDNLNSISCSTESKSNTSEPDVVVEERDVPRAKIEIKRNVNTKRVSKYVSGFIQNDWHEEQPSVPSILVVYLPLVCNTPEWRARKLVLGYQSLVEEQPAWNDSWMKIRMIPAPLSSTPQVGALTTTETIVSKL